MGRQQIHEIVAEERAELADAAQIIDRLTREGHRLTTPRQAIIKLVAPRQDHFSAQEVWDEVRERYSGIGRATVFRTLDLLTELGVLNRIHTGDGCHRYTVCETTHHHHLMCVECGTVSSLEAAGIEHQIRRLATEAGFDLLTHHLELVGRCANCRARGDASVIAE
ncbi:MAG: transcriptional repressor [Chloroflexota bacterium]|nr:transcriptional repressor [Chloroflexota bacterium]